MQQQQKDPLHGVTLLMILNELHFYYGWEQMAYHIPINCFMTNPTIKSSLNFLRKTPWARKKVENLFLEMLEEKNGEV